LITQPEIQTNEVNDTSDIVISVKNVFKSFANNHVLRDFSIDLRQGENLVVLGKSGSGKSVLIKCIIGLLKPDKGTITVLGKDVTKLDHQELDELRAKVGFLFQSNALYDSMTVRQNLQFPLRRHWIDISKEEEEKLVIEALANVGLEKTIDMRPSELSGGMKKRIALARTLILKPEIILYDEPTTGLDPLTGKEISRLMCDLAKKYNTSAITISHDMNCVKIVASRIVLLVDGKCYANGTYEELKNSDDEIINSFFE
jgi:phospholipid/cholesterol/gamma-HCH transport system ATP-binding protein